MTPTCPHCDRPATASMTTYGLRHECCGLWSWGGKPLVDRTTHDARKTAHNAFDAIWKSGRLSRSRAYRMLAEAMGLDREDCHIALFNTAQCEDVIRHVTEWSARAALGEKE